MDIRNADGLDAGETFVVKVASSQGERLVVTLTWTDPPAGLGAGTPTVNVLGLSVHDPSGAELLGNHVTAGQSATGGTPDILNTTQMVIVPSAALGTWTVTVGASTLSRPKQGLALVVSGAVAVEAVDDTHVVRTTTPLLSTTP